MSALSFTVTSPIFHSAHLWHAYTISLCSVPAQAIVAPLSILSPREAVWNCWPLPSPLQPRRRLRPWNYGNGIRRRSPWLIDEQSRASHAGSGDGTDVHAVLGVTHHHSMRKPGGTRNHGSPSKDPRKWQTLLHKTPIMAPNQYWQGIQYKQKKICMLLSVLPQYSVI